MTSMTSSFILLLLSLLLSPCSPLSTAAQPTPLPPVRTLVESPCSMRRCVPEAWSSPFLPTLPSWLGVPNDGLVPSVQQWLLYQQGGSHAKRRLSLWSTVAAREAYEAFWSPLARATLLTSTDLSQDTARLALWAGVFSSDPLVLLDWLTLGCLSNVRFLAHILSMPAVYASASTWEVARFLAFHVLTCAPLVPLLAACALGLRTAALLSLAVLFSPVLLASGPLDTSLLLSNPGLVLVSAALGALAAAVLHPSRPRQKAGLVNRH
jgi:hypothetical protein